MTSWRMIPAGLLLLIALPLSHIFGNNILPQQTFRLKNFKLAGYKASGELDWVLLGSEATATGHRVVITRLQARLYLDSGIELLLLSPSCEFGKIDNAGRGNDTIHVRNNSMTIDGVGFDFDLGSRRIKVRKNVRVRFFKDPADLLGKETIPPALPESP